MLALQVFTAFRMTNSLNLIALDGNLQAVAMPSQRFRIPNRVGKDEFPVDYLFKKIPCYLYRFLYNKLSLRTTAV